MRPLIPRTRPENHPCWRNIFATHHVLLTFTLLTLLAATLAGANTQVTQTNPGTDQNTTSITLHPDPAGGPDLLICGYNNNPFGFSGIGTSWSPDGGLTWIDSATQMAPVFNVNLDASVASDGAGVVFAAMASYDQLPPTNMNSGIFVSASFDGGQNFLPPVGVMVMNSPPGGAPWLTKPKIDADTYHAQASPYAGQVYVVFEADLPWTGWINGPSDIRFSTSTDQGTTWGPTPFVNDNIGQDIGLWPDLDVGSDGSVVVGWVDTPYWLQHQGTLMIDQTLDGGATFGQDVPAVSFWCVPQMLNDQGMPRQATHAAMSYTAIAKDPSNPAHIGAVFAADPDDGPAGEARVDIGDMPTMYDAGLLNPFSGASNVAQTIGYAHACWSETRGNIPDVFYNRMPLGSLPPTWSGPELVLSTQPFPQHRAANNANIVCSGTGVYVAWDEWIGVDYSNLIFINCSNDEGTTWLPQPVALDSHGRVCYEPWVTVNGQDHVVVAWLEDDQIPAADTDIYVNYSSDGGQTWQSPEIQVPTVNRAFDHDIDSWYDYNTGSHMVYLTWAEEDGSGVGSQIMFSVSNDGGATWLPSRRLDSAPAGTALYAPKICQEFGNVYVCWQDTRAGIDDVYFNWSPSHGVLGWAGEVQLDTSTSRDYCSQIACGQGNVYVVYESDRNSIGGNEDIYCNYSIGGGGNWQGEGRVDTDPFAAGHSVYPRLTVGGGDGSPTPYVVWMDDRFGSAPFSGWDAFCNFSPDGGTTWSQDFRIDVGTQPGSSDTWLPHICGMNPVFIYRDERNVPGVGDIYGNVLMYGPDEGDIFYTESFDNGQTWLNPPLRVNDDIGGWNDQSHGWIDIKPSGIVDVVWYDKRGDPMDRALEVMFAALLPGAPGFTPNVPVTNQQIVVPMSGYWIGDYIGVVVDDLLAHVAWADNRRELTLFDAYYANVENPQQEEYGACCLPTGECTVVSAGECSLMMGEFMGPGVLCDPYPCGGSDVPDGWPQGAIGMLHGNYPNPFNPMTIIEYELGQPAPISLVIYDVQGRKVKELVSLPLQAAGRHEVAWHGKDDAGRGVAAGVYFCCLRAGDQVSSQPMALIR